MLQQQSSICQQNKLSKLRNRRFTIEPLEARHLLSVTGIIWHDLDADGIRAPDEPGLASAEVRLLDENAQLVATAQTDTEGAYGFPVVASGTYRAQLAAPDFLPGGIFEGFRVTTKEAGSDPDVDSDFAQQTRQTDLFEVVAGSVVTSLDGGLYMPVTIGGTKFQDANGDGFRALDEQGQDDRTVQLRTPSVQTLVSSGNILARPIDVATEASGSLIVVNRNSRHIVRVDPQTGDQESISFGGPHLLVPVGVAVNAQGDVLVIDLETKKLVSVDFQTGAASVVASGGEITRPTGIAVEPDGNILLTIADTKKLVRVTPSSGEQQVLSQGGEMAWPTAVDVADDGRIFVADWHGKVIRVDPLTGAQEIVTEGSDLEEAGGLVVGPDGQLFVVGQKLRKIIRVDPVTGNQFVVAENGDFRTPGGVAMDSSGNLIVVDETASFGAGAVIRVAARQVLGEVVTQTDGGFAFSDLDPGRYELYVLPENGWSPTTQNPLIVEVSSGEHESRDLGSFATVSITGTKFHDLNGDGIQDEGEPGQAGWTVFLDLNGNGAPSIDEPSMTTSEDGSFAFGDIGAGSYQILTRQKNGWQPSHASISVTVNSSADLAGVDLGSTFGEPMGEVGVITDLTDIARTVVFQQEYDAPVVIAKSSSFNGGTPTVVRITDVQSDRFSLYLQEAPDADGRHTEEAVSYLVLEAGLWELPDGTKLEVGAFDTAATAPHIMPNSWPTIDLASPFRVKPVVLSQVQTNNDTSYVSTRQMALSRRRLRIALEEEEASTQTHGQETIGWIAIEPGSGTWGDSVYQAAQTEINSRFQFLHLDAAFSDVPALFTGLASYNDADPAHLRFSTLSPSGFELKIEEDRSVDVEGWHPNEEAAFFAIGEQSGLLYAGRQKPNVVLISFDDLNDWIGPLGGYAGTVHTPNLDALFSRSTVFTNGHVPGPKCNSSRTSVMTGLHPITTGIVENGVLWRDVVPDAVTLPAYFRQNGYTTAGYGKLFHAPNPRDGDPVAWDVTAPFGAALEFSSGDAIERTLGFPIGAVDAPESEFRDGRIVGSALDFLNTGMEAPFFLGMGLFHPHPPWLAPREYFDLYPIEEIVLPELPPDDLEDLPDYAIQNIVDAGLHEAIVSSGKWELVVQAYLAQISFADALVGQLLDRIEASPYAGNTIVAIWSDHGYHLGEKQSWHKTTLWEESTRVPFAIAGPGVNQPGQTINEAVGLVDLYPTLAELAQLPNVSNIDGQSLAPLIDGSEPSPDRPAFAFHEHGSVVRSTDWSYIRYVDGSEELYDMQNDPGQVVNLAGDELFDAVLQQQRIELETLLASRTFVVNSILDTPDANPGDGFAEDADGNVTLRAAIEEANALSGTPTIHFDIPGSGPHSIKLDSALPMITDPVIIDGTTESDYAGVPVIELDGSNAGPDVHGLVITGGGSTVRGLSIKRFASGGIVLAHGGGNTIAANLIGTDLHGMQAQRNGQNGIVVFNSANNVIGGASPGDRNGASPGDRNIVSGNEIYGIYIAGSGSTGNMVQNNLVGLGTDGVSVVGNGKIGVRIGGGASDNRVTENIIAGNGAAGVRIDGQQTSRNVIAANSIGVDATNTRLLGNQGRGVVIDGASWNLVGGVTGHTGNVIAGNSLVGVAIAGDTSRGNAIHQNSMYSNGNSSQLGIDLDHNGRTPNDVTAGDEDSDVGANNLQNYPTLESASLLSGDLVIGYSVPSATSNSAYLPGGLTIEFFLADGVDGEGQTYLGSDTYTEADATNFKTTTLDVLGFSVAPGDPVVATATDVDGNTSEFSFSVAVATGSPLLAATLVPNGGSAGPLPTDALARIGVAALTRWSDAFLNANQMPALHDVNLRRADLPGALLGLTTGDTILVGVDAAGHGWFIDRTPLDDEEFDSAGDSEPSVSLDLLSAIMHELSHVLGLADLYDERTDDHLMTAHLAPGERRAITGAAVDEIFSRLGLDNLASG